MGIVEDLRIGSIGGVSTANVQSMRGIHPDQSDEMFRNFDIDFQSKTQESVSKI